MKRLLLLLLCLGLVAAGSCFAQKAALEEAERLEGQGQFQAAAGVLSRPLEDQTLPAAARKRLEFELDRLERIKKDFPLTEDELFTELKKSVKNLTADEYDRWVQEGRFDSREIDGRRWFMAQSVPNLFFRYPDLHPRRLPSKNSAALEKRHWETCAAIKKAALAEAKPYVLPKRFHATMTVTAQSDAAPAGEIIRAWLPIPRQYSFHGDFVLRSASPPAKSIDTKQSPIRCVFLEQPARKNGSAEFKIEYDYTTHGVWFDVRPEAVQAPDTADSTLAEFTAEAPHIVFSPEMRDLSRQIAGTETNPYLKAKKFYDWIADTIKYSFAIEYSTIRNIGDYCRSRGYGDCGQEALLFMTLCRLNGIPARWQSGWNTFPGAKSIHDWTEIYLAPYGWIPVDPYMGIYAMRYATTLAPEQRRDIRDFYFGGLDQYRMIANSDHNQTLNPPKQSMRSDNVDFQRGELEWGNHNIYFDRFSYELSVKEVKLPPGRLD